MKSVAPPRTNLDLVVLDASPLTDFLLRTMIRLVL